MKTKITTVLFSFIAIFALGQKANFNIKYSEQLAVFVFIQNLSENYPENVFKTEFQQSKYNTQKYKDLLLKFDKLSFDYSYPFDEYPYGSKIPMQSRDVLKKNLIETSNLNDFKLRSIGIVPNKTLHDLAEIISEFIPVYNELIYIPNKEKFETQLKEITNYSNEKNIEHYFQTGLRFYNSSWDDSIPFEIAFYPLPNSKGFTAQAFYNNFISAIQTDLKDYKSLFSVMLHETYHIIYDEQSLEIKKNIAQYFKENPSKYSNYAYMLLNEALATALGNGYVYEQLDGKTDTNDWYYSEYINLMAKQIYPMVKEYIILKKPIDKNFIDSYIKLYGKSFPNWINELDHIMTYRYIMSENEKDLNTIRQMFPSRSSEENEMQISIMGLEKMKKTPLTKIIIVSKNNAEKLKLIKTQFKELKKWNFNADKEFSYKILLEDKSQLLIINQNKSALKTLINSIQ
ncbi:uncharacterized protein DUF3974 [Chryseobacterium sp. 52]|uniref:DUF3974 domain-containing protein n=1 Tax=Chryseobacterium sp. 52 TaxID=2035213 RepID=UPI000C1A6267|nr:DUF3974 domain-containing protein [Chryseobacterium sp. 52]PIF47511.1 uncharacterized protein DUF3974 [Chryseobacterium sp. 52]